MSTTTAFRDTTARTVAIITGGAVAQACVNSHWLSQWETFIFDPHRIDVP